jgi:hypothetical protein
VDVEPSLSLPAALTWGEYVRAWTEDVGGWTQLANELIDRCGRTAHAGAAEVPDDPQSVERGLRRLATRGHKPGGQYGRWMLRYFGFVAAVDELVKWMGQYHTRFADLPCGFRLEHLTLWNRPPIAESRLAAWIHVGIAHAHLSRREPAAAEHWLASARRLAPRAGPAAEIECQLAAAYMQADLATLDAIDLDRSELGVLDQRVYRARLADQRAQLLTRAETPDVRAARALYDAIDETPYQPFVSFRRAVGLAYCAWKLDDRAQAIELAQRAVEHAGDGGLLRMRVNALNMLSRVLEGSAALATHERAARIAAQLEDEELMTRVAQCVPARQ